MTQITLTQPNLIAIFKKLDQNINLNKIHKTHKVSISTLQSFKNQGYEISLIKTTAEFTKNEKKAMIQAVYCEKIKECFNKCE